MITKDEFLKLAEGRFTKLEIPDFQEVGKLTILVQRPQILRMAKDGKIPNPLMGTVVDLVMGNHAKKLNESKDKGKIKLTAETLEVYCHACMVEPTYKEVGHVMTDLQKSAVFEWAIKEVSALEEFHTD